VIQGLRNGSATVHPSNLVLSVEVRETVLNELNRRKNAKFRDEDRQGMFLEKVGETLEIIRIFLTKTVMISTTHLENVRRSLAQVIKHLSKIPENQRSELNRRIQRNVEALQHERKGERQQSKTAISDEEYNIDMLSGLSVARFQWESSFMLDALDAEISDWAKIPKEHNYVGPPPVIRKMIRQIAYYWWAIFDERPSIKPNGAFGQVINRMLTSLEIEPVGVSALKSILRP
jgi:hypothetical protein